MTSSAQNIISAAKCPCVSATDSEVELAEPCVGDLPRGSAIRFKCKEGTILTGGQLELVCGPDGQFLGQMPNCTSKIITYKLLSMHAWSELENEQQLPPSLDLRV